MQPVFSEIEFLIKPNGWKSPSKGITWSIGKGSKRIQAPIGSPGEEEPAKRDHSRQKQVKRHPTGAKAGENDQAENGGRWEGHRDFGIDAIAWGR